jgi:hypothetical protein
LAAVARLVVERQLTPASRGSAMPGWHTGTLGK